MKDANKANGGLVLDSIKAAIKKIDESKLNAVVTRCDDLAFELAKRVDGGHAGGRLEGKAILIKDNVLLKGHRVFCASGAWDGLVSDRSAVVIERLINEGAVIVGVCNMDEFAMGASNLTSVFGGVVHPLGDDRVVGGSSGGSAAAVAARLCFSALGTDTGGSIRQPASYCGVVGLKPSFGAISMEGVVPLVAEWDVIGPIASSVGDCRLMFEIMSGVGENTVQTRVGAGLKVGVIGEFLDFMRGDDKVAFEKARDRLVGMGHEIVEVGARGIEYAGEIYEVMGCVESYLTMKDLGVEIERLGDEARGRVMRGKEYLNDAKRMVDVLEKERVLKDGIEEAFGVCDFLVTPSVPSVAFRASEGDSFAAKNSDVYLRPFNISGHPALSIPFGSGEGGLPIGVQLVGRMGDEGLLFEVGELLEKN